MSILKTAKEWKKENPINLGETDEGLIVCIQANVANAILEKLPGLVSQDQCFGESESTYFDKVYKMITKMRDAL